MRALANIDMNLGDGGNVGGRIFIESGHGDET